MSRDLREIRIKVDSSDGSNIVDAAKKLDQLNKSAKSVAGQMNFLTNAFTGWLSYLGISEIVRTADTMQNLSNKLKIVTGSTEGATDALLQLSQVSQRTNQGIQSTGEVYTRLANSLVRTKATTSEVLALTETLVNTFRIAGATTTETTNTIIQLSQAFSAGELRGQELRSVMEQNATLARLLQERFKGDVFKKAAQGLITLTDVLETLADAQKNVNSQAELLTPTFGQTLIKAFDKVALKINEVNIQFGLSKIFADIMKLAVDNLAQALTILGIVAVAVAAKKLPALIVSIKATSAALLALAVNNPITAVLTGLAVIIASVVLNWDKWVKIIKKAQVGLYEFAADLVQVGINIEKFMSGGKTTRSIERAQEQLLSLQFKIRDLRTEISKTDLGALTGETAEKDKIEKEIRSLIEKQKQLAKLKKIEDDRLAQIERQKARGQLGVINDQFGSIGPNEYNKKLIEVNRENLTKSFFDAKISVFEFNKSITDLNIKELQRKMAEGSLSLKDFNAQVDNQKFLDLKLQQDAGLITMKEYNKELIKLDTKFSESSPFTVGVDNYLESIGNLAQGIAKSVEGTFSKLEDTLVEFIRTGKFQFKDFADYVISEMIRITVRQQILGPLTSAFGSLFSAGATAAVSSAPVYAPGPNLGIDYSIRSLAPQSGLSPTLMGSSMRNLGGQSGQMGEGPVSVGVTVNMNGASSNATVESNTAFGDNLGKAVVAAVRKELLEQRRPGGLIS